MRSSINLPLLALVLSGMCGCEVDQPLSDPMTAKADDDLVGHWTGVDSLAGGKKEVANLFIGKHADKGNPDSLMETIMVTFRPSDKSITGTEGANSMYYFSTSKIGKLKFINVFYDSDQSLRNISSVGKGSYKKWAKSKTRSCVIYGYKTDGKELTLSQLSGEAKDRLVKSGDLVEEGKLLTASSLVKYIKSHGTKDFELLKPVFRKVKSE